MGFFSFITNDTNSSIPNVYSTRETFTVYMMDDKGNTYREDKYEGYGEFGGKDYYELLAEMNGLKTRSEGINLAFSGRDYICPNLVEDSDWEWQNVRTEDCPNQGFFYN